MKSKLYILFLFTILVSCEKDIEVNIPYENPRTVLNASFWSGDSLWAEITKSRFILENNVFERITDAEIKVLENGVEAATLYNTPNGFYSSGLISKEGATYKLIVIENGVETVEAETTIPFKVPIISVNIDSTRFDGLDYYVFKIKLNDPGEVDNYYNLRIEEEITEYLPGGDSIKGGGSLYIESHFDPLLDDIIWQENKGPSFNDIIFNGGEYELSVRSFKFNSSFNPNPVDQKIEYKVILSSITEDQYKYDVAIAKYQDTKDDPFSEPVFIPSNVKNGLGIVSGKSFSSQKIKKP